jgi:hypothetical protein
MGKHHIIYRTTNLLNNRYYIGMHSTENIDDGYLGSGRRIKAEIKKYGKENFVRDVLEILPSREALKLREAEIVNVVLLEDKLCLNLKDGGEGGFDHLNSGDEKHKARSAKAGHLGGEAFAKRLASDASFAESFSVVQSARMSKQHADGKIKYDTFTGRKHSEETKQKMREAKQARDLKRTMGFVV